MTEPRDRALSALFEIDQRGFSTTEAVKDLPAKAQRLVRGVLEHRQAIDELIGSVSTTWRLERMPAVDRCLLRLGTFELLWERETPVGVVLNEAVQLAKIYSTEKSGAFVNGVLSAIAKERSDE